MPREKHKRRRVARTSDRQLSPGVHDDDEGGGCGRGVGGQRLVHELSASAAAAAASYLPMSAAESYRSHAMAAEGAPPYPLYANPKPNP